MDKLGEFLAKDLCSINKWSLSGIDCFGEALSFQINNKSKYKTRLGGFFTLLYIGGIISMVIYYSLKVINRTDFTININEYRTGYFMNSNLVNGEFEIYFTAVSLREGGYMDWEAFWGSLSIIASEVHYDYNLAKRFPERSTPMQAKLMPHMQWKDLKFMPCKHASWLNQIPNDSEADAIRDFGICFDAESMNVFGGSSRNSKKISMDLYPCQKDYYVPCNNKYNPSEVLFRMNVISKSVNMDNYKEPYDYTVRNLFHFIPSESLAYINEIELGKID